MRRCVAILETASICYCVKHKRNFQQIKREICVLLLRPNYMHRNLVLPRNKIVQVIIHEVKTRF